MSNKLLPDICFLVSRPILGVAAVGKLPWLENTVTGFGSLVCIAVFALTLIAQLTRVVRANPVLFLKDE